MRTSFLTLGGYDAADYTGNITWFDTINGVGWNQTITELKYNGESVVEESDRATAVFETGYPYIGFSETFFDKIAKVIMLENYSITCEKGEHWGLCRAQANSCDILKLDYNLTLVINDVDFIIPLRNMAVTTRFKNEAYC